ncbi:MAG: DNA mismatch repair protein MutS [Candidatus Gracilibacteria bacterium]
MSAKTLTPMMAQYQEIKAQYPDAILFYRLGDFYEMFFDDAVEASQLLQLTLTSRNKGDHKAPMCGIPYHAAQNYIAKLTKLGKKIAICEQLSDPDLPGIVKRDVVRIITPGTTLDEHVLDQKNNNYTVAIVERDGRFGLASADLSTGQFQATELENLKDFLTEIERIRPVEAILEGGKFSAEIKKQMERSSLYFFEHSAEHLSGTPGDQASALLLDYLQKTQKTDLHHLKKAEHYRCDDFMALDESTLKNLELLSTLRENGKEGSLLWVLDETVTSMGGRYLRHVLTHPLLDRTQIEHRLDAVEVLTRQPVQLDDVRTALKNILDLERLLARLSLGHGNARDLLALKNSLQSIPVLQKLVAGFSSDLIAYLCSRLHGLPDLVQLLSRALVDEPPLAVREGGMIREGYDRELDELKKISREGKGYIQSLQEKEIARTGINSLKIRYNSVFGYYIEISKANLHAAPQDYIRKQTLVNAERFITPELKEYEEKVLGAEEKIVTMEYNIFHSLRETVVANIQQIQELAQAIAQLDTFCSLATVALTQGYCKPKIHDGFQLSIREGRHPVVEKMSHSGKFVPNDAGFDDDQKLLLITGPNMGGKSTYLRQTALIVLMAHLGSFVPAAEANIGLVDRIFTRVGASDNLVRGQSTFMVEMQETSFILNNATARSLIILDEVGRGTSTYDGMSIAWAIVEFLHDVIGAKTLFATHYHELIALADKLPYAANYSVAVKENETDGVVFLYKIVQGGVDRSYGIEVAKLAGLPTDVVMKARQILIDLEEGSHQAAIQAELDDTTKRVPADQTALFERQHQPVDHKEPLPISPLLHPAVEELQKLDINSLTPIEALNRIAELQKKSHD